MAEMTSPAEGAFESFDGLKIFYRAWRPPAPRAVLVICHGVNSHGGQYLWSSAHFSAHGYATYAIDLRGRGQSDGVRFHVDDVAEYVADLAGLIKIAKQENPGLKVFLLGHSAGGVVSCSYALDYQRELAGLICESFAFRVPAPGFALQLIKLFAALAPKGPGLKLKMEDFSRDPAAVKALLADPLTKDETQTLKLVASLVRADERLEKEFPTITLPVFIMHGTADKATVPSGSQFFYDTAGSKDKTLKFYDGHYHDLLNDIGKEQVLADMQAWIDQRI